MEFTRRELIQHSADYAWAAALGGLLPRWAWAAPAAPDRFFVLLRTFGGMDVTLGLDPQVLPAGADEKDIFLEYRSEDILSVQGLRLGPAAAALAPFAAECLAINGVMMRRDAGHDVINLYMASGRGDGKSATISAELAMCGCGPLGLVINDLVYLAGKPVTLSSTQDILADKDGSVILGMIEDRLAHFADHKGLSFSEAQRQMVSGKAAAARLTELLQDFSKQTPKLEDKHVVAAAFAAGGARQAQLNIAAFNLDTHTAHEKNHLSAQKKVWEQVADLFKLFKSVPYRAGSLFDATTFMVISEFSRTPALNAAKGKDHNPFTNSVLLAGAGIQGGKSVGASRLIARGRTVRGEPDHIAHPFDYKLGKPAEKAEGASFIFPENVIQTVGTAFGSPAGFCPVAKTVPILPGVVRTLA